MNCNPELMEIKKWTKGRGKEKEKAVKGEITVLMQVLKGLQFVPEAVD